MHGKFKVIDVHQHVGSLGDSLGDYGGAPAYGPQAANAAEEIKNRAKSLEDCGVDAAIVQPAHTYLDPDGIKDTMKVNDRMADYRRRDPVHFSAAFGTVECLHGERSLGEIDRAKEIGLVGLSWHHRLQGVFIDNKWMRLILKRMSDLGLAPIIHAQSESSMEAPWRLQRLAKEFPETTFLSNDAFSTMEGAQMVLATASQAPNIIWDFGHHNGIVNVDLWVKMNGSTTIAFSGVMGGRRGTPHVPELVEEVMRAKITDEDRANILSGNVERFLAVKKKG